MDDSCSHQVSPQKRFEKTLPDPLTSIEKFHFFDGDEAHPNLIAGRLLFDESIDEVNARLAWKIVTSRQPLICAELRSSNGKLHWALPANFDSTIAAETLHFQRFDLVPAPWTIPARLDPKINPGPFLSIRIWDVWRDSDSETTAQKCERAEIWFWAHHILCDGAAAVVFINDWLQVYRNLVANRNPLQRVSKIDPLFLALRNRLGICSWDFIKHLPHQVVGLFGAAKFIFRKTATTAENSRPSHDPIVTRCPAIVSERLPAEALKCLLQDADRLEASLNSVLLTDLFRTLHKWRVKHTDDVRSRDWLRIILPMNIREFKHRKMPLANRTSIVQIDRREFESTSRDEMIRSIDREIKIIRRWRLDRMFLIVVRVLSLFESRLRKAAQNEKSRGIAVFTNLGRPFKQKKEYATAGGQGALNKLLEFDFVGPIRKGTPFNFAVGTLRQGLYLTLHFDSHFLSANDADDLLSLYCKELADSEQRLVRENGDESGFVNQNS